MAALVDSLLLLLLQVLVLGVMGVVLTVVGDDQEGHQAGPWIVAGLALLSFALLWGYYLLFEMIWNGQSPGKRWVGLRVIKDSGAPISFVDSTIRNLVRLVDFLPVYYGIGVIVMFFNDRAQRLGDLAAGTVVVRERKEVTLASLTAASHSPPPPDSPADLEVSSLTPDDYDLIVRFLQRRQELANRADLACKLASTVAARLGLSPQGLSPSAAEEFLERVADACRRRARAGGG